MAEIADDGGGGGHHKGKKRAKKQSTRVDMTPMVDLAFLLLTFFVLTSTFSKPKSMELTYPVPPEDPKNVPQVKNGITFLLTEDDRLFYYKGEFKRKDHPEGAPTQITEIDYSQSGLHRFLADENKWAQEQIQKLNDQFAAGQLADTTHKRMVRQVKSDKVAPTVLIKPDDKATYKNVIDLIDELNINLVGKYVVIDPLKEEAELVKEKTGV